MKKHILSNFANVYNYQKQPMNYYDEVTQLSYNDKQFRKKVVNRYDVTKSTNTIENSDPDEFQYKSSTTLTFTVENSDEDELYMIGQSIETRVIESSDPDEFVC